jgi:hypothetical protein
LTRNAGWGVTPAAEVVGEEAHVVWGGAVEEGGMEGKTTQAEQAEGRERSREQQAERGREQA